MLTYLLDLDKLDTTTDRNQLDSAVRAAEPGLEFETVSGATATLLLVNPVAFGLVQLFQLNLQVLTGGADTGIANSGHKLSNFLKGFD